MASALAAGFVLAASLQIVGAAATPEGVVQWDVARRQPHPRLKRRASNSDLTTIANNVSFGGYFATCKIGTPPQTLTLQLDTGSSDIWVPSSDASVCSSSSSRSQASAGCSLGSFDSSSSSTFAIVGQDDFDIQYVDGSHAQGDYFSDVFTIGSSTLTNMTMGLGESTDIAFGLVGVGYATNEAIVSTEQSFSAAYPNLPAAMVKEGVIKTNAYSLWLNDLDASTGNILFGGIDTEKYKGDMQRIDVYKDSGSSAFTSFIVALTSVDAVSPTGTDKLTSRRFPIAVVLDSGTTLSYLPTDLAAEIWTEVGAEYSADVGLAVIPCSKANSGGYISFGFAGPGGPVINVTMDELVLDLSTNGQITFGSGQHKGQAACEFGIQNTTSDPFLLGDTFLRSAYVVYDLVNNQIGMAATEFNATKSNVVAFASSGAAIPSSTVAPNQDQVSSLTTFTTPAYAAASGFSSGSSAKSASHRLTAPVLEPLCVFLLSASMFFAGGLFLM